MGSFGERMRREREMRGIKLEDISESTKISRRNLLALEEEHFDRLPGGIFNKGFVRAYARFLGLNEEEAVQDFMTASADYEQPAALQRGRKPQR
jgi:cytoskeleton protein RodZ